MLQKDIEAYIKRYDIYLTLKAICYKLYKNLQLLSILTHWWKDLLIDFVTGLLISANWKDDSYNLIRVMIDQYIKIVYYEPVKIMINASSLAKVIINVVVRYHTALESIFTD